MVSKYNVHNLYENLNAIFMRLTQSHQRVRPLSALKLPAYTCRGRLCGVTKPIIKDNALARVEWLM